MTLIEVYVAISASVKLPQKSPHICGDFLFKLPSRSMRQISLANMTRKCSDSCADWSLLTRPFVAIYERLVVIFVAIFIGISTIQNTINMRQFLPPCENTKN